MWANDLSAGFLARDAGKVASGPMVQTKRGIFLYAEITGLTCENVRLRRAHHGLRQRRNEGLAAQIPTRSPGLFSDRRSGSRTKLEHTNFRQTSGVKPAVEGLTSIRPNCLNVATWLAPDRTPS